MKCGLGWRIKASIVLIAHRAFDVPGMKPETPGVRPATLPSSLAQPAFRLLVQVKTRLVSGFAFSTVPHVPVLYVLLHLYPGPRVDLSF